MSSKTKESVSQYIDQLTWLRGFACFLVIVSHTLRATEVKYTSLDEVKNIFFISFFDMGTFGVVLFFVLSGCTLYVSNSGKISLGNIHNFYTKRFFRIWPAYFVSLIIYMCFGLVFSALYVDPQGYWIERQFLTSYSIYDVFSYLFLVFNFTGPTGLFNGAYWSLPVEFQFYIIFPVIVASLKYVGMIGPISISIALYLLPKLGIVDFDKDAFFTLAFSFCGGVMIGHIYKSSSVRLNFILGSSLLISFLVLCSAIKHSYIVLPDIPVIADKNIWYGCIAIASVYILLVTKINFHNKIELFFKHYGTISYSTYLYHTIFVSVATLLTIHLEIYDGSARLFITLFFTLFASYIAASWSYRYIEYPSIAMGRRVIGKVLATD